MEFYDLFYKWVPMAVRLPVLFLLAFVLLSFNGVYLGNVIDMYSALGDYAEPFTVATNCLYLGMGLCLLIIVRLKQRFPGKVMLLYGLTTMLAMNIVCATTGNPWVMVGATLFLGFSKMTAFIEVLIMWLGIWSKKLDITRVYPFIYSTALASIYFMTWFMSREAYIRNWRMAYLAVYIVLGVCLILVLLLVEKHPLKKVVPLYQIDWVGMMLFAASMMLLNYVVTYGKVEDWFQSEKIRAASFVSLLLLLLYSRRQLVIKRPLINLVLFRQPKVRTSLILFFVLGIFTPTLFQSALSGGILRYETMRSTAINLYLIPGVFIGAVLCYIWYEKNLNPRILMIAGFISFVIYHILMYNRFSVQFSYDDFIVPSLVKGFATVLLYISLGLFATNKLPLPLALPAVGMVLVVRSFLAVTVFGGVYNYLLYAQQWKHINYIGGLTDTSQFRPGSPVASEYSRLLEAQATLAASKELTGYIIIAGIFVSVLVIIWSVRGWLIQRYAVLNQPEPATGAPSVQ
ncbi:MAG: hypothetical protein ABWZ25_11970 [Chitinophagaceae bacterium]